MSDHPKRPIVLIHGLWMTPRSWSTWAERFRARGHEVLVPGWPGIGDRSPADIRRDPTALEGIGIRQLLDHYVPIVSSLPVKPIVMGHSFGGLVTLLLADRNLGASYVAVQPGPPAGILTVPPAMLWTGFPVLSNPFGRNGATPISRSHFQFAFCNDLTRAESDAEWEANAVNSANAVLFDGVLNLPRRRNAITGVDWGKPDRAPLLILGGECDHAVPAATVRAIAKAYRGSGGPAVVEHREFPGRTHRIVSQRGWEEVADGSLEWATRYAESGNG